MSSKVITDVYKQAKGNRRTAKAEGTHAVKQEQDIPSRSVKSDEEVLRDFDLTLEFGPCVGISRLERWERAQKHGLNPPTGVRDLIMKHPHDASYTQSLWKDYNI